MGKKCIPGVLCIENMTLFLILFILLLVVHLYYKQSQTSEINKDKNVYFVMPGAAQVPVALANENDPVYNVYAPPLKDGTFFRRDSGDPRGIPINVQTRSINDNYRQMGILTRKNDELILPLMGRQLTTGNYKWLYYTMATTGNMNTKLPISLNGKSCTSEYGCDSLSNGDVVYVEGYSDTFRVTLYENSTFNYIPFV
jgi:Family of unknown function (DUF5755)